jgi:hypothetical protein
MKKKTFQQSKAPLLLLSLLCGIVLISGFFLFAIRNTDFFKEKENFIPKLAFYTKDIGNPIHPTLRTVDNQFLYWDRLTNELISVTPEKNASEKTVLFAATTPPETILWSNKGTGFVLVSETDILAYPSPAEEPVVLPFNLIQLVWSPDDKKIAYQLEPSEELLSDIVVLDMETKERERVATIDLSDYDFTSGILSLAWLSDNETLLYAPETTDQDVATWWRMTEDSIQAPNISTVWTSANLLSLSPDESSLLVEIPPDELNIESRVYGILNIETQEITPTSIDANQSLCLWETADTLLCLTERAVNDRLGIEFGSISILDGSYTLYGVSADLSLDNMVAGFYDDKRNNFYLIPRFNQMLTIIPLEAIRSFE